MVRGVTIGCEPRTGRDVRIAGTADRDSMTGDGTLLNETLEGRTTGGKTTAGGPTQAITAGDGRNVLWRMPLCGKIAPETGNQLQF